MDPPARPRLTLIEGTPPRARATPRPSWSAATELAALGLGFVLTMALLAAVPAWDRHVPRVQGLAAIAFGFQVLALLRRARWRELPHVGAIVFIVALAARVAMVPVAPTLSDDVYRYVWEGRVLAAGHDPWRHAPDDPVLAPLRDRIIYPHVNHPSLAAIYPPLSVLGFALVTRVSPTVTAMKLWILLHELALVALLVIGAARFGLGPAAAIAYAWNPLVVIEYAGNGHHDPTALLWLALAIGLGQRRPVLSAGAAVLATMVKLAPVVAVPFLWRRWTNPARAVAAIGLLVGLLSYAALTRQPHSGLAAYAAVWRNNELLFGVLEWLTRDGVLARVLGVGIVVGVLGVAWRRDWHAARATAYAIRVALLVSPVVHPWYLGWVLVFEPLGPSWPWLVLSLTVLLNYGPLVTPSDRASYHPPLEWRLVEYGIPAVVGWLLWGWRRVRRPGS